MLTGVLLTESLRIGAVLEVPGLGVTRLYRRDVSDSTTDEQPSVWTFLEFEADDDTAGPLAEALARALLAEGGWYADFRVGAEHVVVYADRVFRYHRGDKAARAAAEEHGRSLGVPPHQLDWPD
jgi:hypothetical protein